MTKRNQEILNYIKEYMKNNGVTPTIREIGEGVGLYSTSTVQSHMDRLKIEGEIIPVGSTRYRVKGMEYVDREAES